MVIIGYEIIIRNFFIVVFMYVINRIESDCWFGIVLNFLKNVKISF